MGIGSLIQCPVKPSAIYFGMNCSEKDINDITAIVDKKVTKLSKLGLQNNEYFDLKTIE